MKTPHHSRLIKSLMFDARLKAFDKFLLLLLPYQEQNEDGSYQVSARQLAMFARSSEKTTARAIRTLEHAGYIEIVEANSSSKGGFKVFFRNVGLLAIMLSLLGTGPALHNSSPMDKSARDFTQLHIISQRKRRSNRQSKQVAPVETDLDIQRKEDRRIAHLGQLAVWNHPSSIAARSHT